jgi:hypothetical protein
MKEVSFKALEGKKIIRIIESHDEIIFHTDGGSFKMYHEQDCCETVSIEDIDGDLMDLIGEVILETEDFSSMEGSDEEDCEETSTYTFYKIRTVKSSVTIRWYGHSNGYYSERVDFCQIN